MAKKTPTWLIGCGIGCGALILGLLIMVGLGIAWTRSATKGFDEAVRNRVELEERYGQPEEYTPPPDGAVPRERMEIFLSVRETIQPTRERIAAVFEKMPLSREAARDFERMSFTEKLGQTLDIAGSAMGMAGDLGTFLHERNEALLEAGMSLGEYSYIYSLSYYAYFRKAPGDGPGDLPGEGGSPPDGSTIRVMGTQAKSDVRNNMEAILRNQLAAVPEEEAGLREAVAAELEKMAGDRRYLPWQDGLPEAIRASLEPYEGRLKATYRTATNGFELARVQKKSAVSFTMD